MVLTHQADAHNLLAAASFAGRKALHDLGIADPRAVLTAEQRAAVLPTIAGPTEALLRYLLFRDEAPLQGPLRGVSSFAEDFVRQGPHDRHGRTLRELDLSSRLLRYPLSYLVYSHPFRGLPAVVERLFFERLAAILSGEDADPAYAHLRGEAGRAIAEILADTYDGLPVSLDPVPASPAVAP